MPGDRLGMPPDASEARQRIDDVHFVRALAIAEERIEAKASDVWWNGARARPVMEAKAAVGGVTDDEFPSPLASPAADFLLRMRDRVILDQLVGVRREPMRAPIVLEGAAVTAVRVSPGSAIPALRGDFTTVTLSPVKFGWIVVHSNESLRSSIALQSSLGVLAGAIGDAINAGLLDTGSVDSLLYGQTSFAASGSSAAQVLADLRELCEACPRGNTLAMCRGTATYYGTLQATNGTLLFPNVGPNGGTMMGMPVLINRALEIDDSPASRIVAILSPSDIIVADQGRAILSLSHAGLTEQASDPTGNTVTPTAASKHYTSMFQTESTAIKGIREISWLARSGAAAQRRGWRLGIDRMRVHDKPGASPMAPMAKFYSEEDLAEFIMELGALPQTKSLAEGLPAILHTLYGAIGRTMKRHLAERDHAIAALRKELAYRDEQVTRHSAHLQRLETRIQAVERFKQDKSER